MSRLSASGTASTSQGEESAPLTALSPGATGGAVPLKSAPPVPSTISERQLQALRSLSLSPLDAPVAPEPPRVWLPWTLFCLSLIGSVTFFLTTRPSAEAAPAPAAAAPAEIRPEPAQTAAAGEASGLLAAGYMAARKTITVGAAVPGQIRQMNVENGASIHRGQELARLEDREAQVGLELATLRLRRAELRLTQLQKLLPSQAASPAEVEAERLETELARTEVKLATEKLEQTRIRSPIDGTVLEVLTHPSEVVQGMWGGGVVKVADLTQLAAEVDVNELDLPKVHPGQPAMVTSDVYPGRTYEGAVGEISGQADKARGTVKVRVFLDVSDGSLRPGMSVKAQFSQPNR